MLSLAALPGLALGRPGHDHNVSGGLVAVIAQLVMRCGHLRVVCAVCAVK